jgi:hypothetical protein
MSVPATAAHSGKPEAHFWGLICAVVHGQAAPNVQRLHPAAPALLLDVLQELPNCADACGAHTFGQQPAPQQ